MVVEGVTVVAGRQLEIVAREVMMHGIKLIKNGTDER